MDPRALWQAGGATALFIAGFGAAGYATRRDLTALARISFWALLALIVVGIVLIFVNIPGGDLVYSILGLVIFAGFTMFDFQRLRTTTETATAPLLAASIFLDILNVFLFFLRDLLRRAALRCENHPNLAMPPHPPRAQAGVKGECHPAP